MITVTRYHDISCGHRVAGHENKCSNLHGHNYRIYFTVEPFPAQELDKLGRVIDFSVIKSKLCNWLEKEWDHRLLLWKDDDILPFKNYSSSTGSEKTFGVIRVPFNPTAENMAKHLVLQVAPILLEGTGTRLRKVTIEETRKCSATYEL